jgi:hypothetical protein
LKRRNAFAFSFARSQADQERARRQEAAYQRQQKARRKATRADEEAADRFYMQQKKAAKSGGRTGRKLSGLFHELYGRNPQFRKSVDEITDRAKRYRANQVRPKGPKRCAYKHRLNPCKGPLGINHRDGNESNGAKSNLNWACKRHNAQLAIYHKAMGQGVRTRQYNPGAGNLAQYVQAAVEHTRGSHDEGGRIIHETPKAKRRQFAREIAFRKTGRMSNPVNLLTRVFPPDRFVVRQV